MCTVPEDTQPPTNLSGQFPWGLHPKPRVGPTAFLLCSLPHPAPLSMRHAIDPLCSIS